MDFLSNVARKLAKCRQKIFWRHLANGQKLAIFKGKSLMNWTFCQMSPENWQNVARKFSGDIWQMAKKLYHYLANGQKIIPLLFGKLPNFFHFTHLNKCMFQSYKLVPPSIE
jgi:hypothetical protein